jgi:rod shape determining protein RodA
MDLSMRVEQRTFFTKLDLNFVFVILILNFIGLINLYSATHGISAENMSNLFVQQIVWLSAGWLLFFILTFVDYQIFFRLAYLFYFLNLMTLLAVTLFGKVAYGAQRWIDLGFFRFQPSETMKLSIIILFARLLAEKNSLSAGMSFKDMLLPLIVLAIPFVLVVEQPDLGTALMMMGIGGMLLLFVKIRRSILISLALIVAIAAPLAWNFVLRDYQKNRVLTFLSPTTDPRGTGYNSIQSKIAVGSGKFLGKGFRNGTQSQLEFIPERHTDFIFSVLSEEHGFLGSMLAVSMFMFLFLVMLKISNQANDKFAALLTMGVFFYVFIHMLVNIGMVIGLLPIVGVPLPLLSYGGTSMLTTMAGLGIVSSVAYRRYLF